MDPASSSKTPPSTTWDPSSKTLPPPNPLATWHPSSGKPPPLDFDLSRMFTAHLTTPVNYWDPEDPSTWDYFLDDDDDDLPSHRYLLSPTSYPPPPNLEITGSFVFELYNIEIVKLDPRREQNFSTILMQSSATNMVRICMYKRPEGEEINLDQPLALKGPFRPPNASYSVIIGLSNPANGGWVFHYDGPEMYFGNKDLVYNTPISELVKDEATDSEALITYELMEKAATATLWFEFLDEEGRNIEILSGTISATNNGVENTLRIIKRVSSNKSMVVKSNERFPVDRSGFGVPIDSVLKVSVQLMYKAAGVQVPKEMCGSLFFPVQQESKCCKEWLTGDDPTVKLSITTSWSDNQWDDI